MINMSNGKAICATVLLAIVGAQSSVWADAAVEESIERGRALAEDRSRGNCYSCHVVEGAELPGDYGPPLFNMKMRFPERATLKAQIADPRVRNPNTTMPPYGAHQILTASELESVVDYIHSL